MSEFWQFWFAYWWLLFPLAGMAYGAFGMWLNYKRSYQAMEVLKAFAANGREPPAEVMAALGSNPAGLNFSSCPSPQRTDPAFAWRAVIPFYAIGAGFTVAAFLISVHDVRIVFIVLAVTFVTMSLGFSLFTLIQGRRHRE
jgi:hypothetical protein